MLVVLDTVDMSPLNNFFLEDCWKVFKWSDVLVYFTSKPTIITLLV